MLPPKTFRSDLAAALAKAAREGVHIDIVPAMLSPNVASTSFLRDLAWSQEGSCVQCNQRGYLCRKTNLSTVRCYDCLGERECSFQDKWVARGHKPNITSLCRSYAKARHEHLKVLPDGAIWDIREAQPPHVKQHVVLKMEATPLKGEEEAASLAELADEPHEQNGFAAVLARLDVIEAKIDILLGTKENHANHALNRQSVAQDDAQDDAQADADDDSELDAQTVENELAVDLAGRMDDMHSGPVAGSKLGPYVCVQEDPKAKHASRSKPTDTTKCLRYAYAKPEYNRWHQVGLTSSNDRTGSVA
ncbi:hypothetical protein L227DRAFT_618103 [Lentinus tigrinus ALCF2SS1-6]|uniref:Uncharacterized protein n=1 Tax=Lentinus tigrinus ALCF2SS1-6 TaxID=1328759 RepID=A0A5C2RMD8_9APHY|nr:hypothetical protein L227DRAFT_618103 [Lentinus tigrinus ALCF2SS1-6]